MESKSSIKRELGIVSSELKYEKSETKRLTKKVQTLGDQVDELKAERAELLDGIIDLLGIRESYQDKTEEYTYTDYHYYSSLHYSVPYERTGTRYDRGRDRFAADIAAAKGAIEGNKALKKIQKALKGKK